MNFLRIPEARVASLWTPKILEKASWTLLSSLLLMASYVLRERMETAAFKAAKKNLILLFIQLGCVNVWKHQHNCGHTMIGNLGEEKRKADGNPEQPNCFTFHLEMPRSTGFCCLPGSRAPLPFPWWPLPFLEVVYIAEHGVRALQQTSSQHKGQTRFHIASCFSTELWVSLLLAFVFPLILKKKKTWK